MNSPSLNCASILIALALIVGCHADAPAEAGKNGGLVNEVLDVSEPINLYESDRSQEALAALSKSSLDQASRDQFALKIMVADGVIGRTYPESIVGPVRARVAVAAKADPLPMAAHYVLASSLDQAGQDGGPELAASCNGDPSSIKACHNMNIAKMLGDAQLMSGKLEARLLRGIALLVQSRVGDSGDLDSAVIFGSYGDAPAEARSLLHSSQFQFQAKEAFCAAVSSAISPPPADREICGSK